MPRPVALRAKHRTVALVLGLLAVGCGGTDPAREPRERWCADAEARLGHRVCVPDVPDAEVWSSITFPAAAVDQTRTTTYLVRARDEAPVPTVFVDAGAFEAPEASLHFKFLTESVPELALMSYDEYLERITDPERRDWFAGALTEYIVDGGDTLLGASISDGGADPAKTLTCAQFRAVLATLDDRVGLGPVAIVPGSDLQRATLESCDVPVHDPSRALDYEVYTRARRCGRMRLYTLAELAQAEVSAAFGWQDILVTDEAPLDVQTVIAGIVTGTRQGELSHLNVRSASRGTPNCYVKDALALLARWEGELVELECGPTEATVKIIAPEDEATCNAGFRPDPIAITPPDLSWTELVPLLEVPTSTVEERRAALSRFGAKGANLATLYQRIDPSLQLQGFLVPTHHGDAFMDTTWSVDLGNGPETLSFRETLARWLADDAFATDGAVRLQRLGALQAAMAAAPCDPALVTALGAQILATYGSDAVMVRFRSSSNAEDQAQFNGAGLYDSTSVCLADETDGDTLGPSRCDATQPNERGVCRGLTRVWSSLWNMKAFEERAWFGIDQHQVAMGILVDTQTKGELANIVAFTGNPLLRGDARYLVNAQAGELAVVAAVPGVWPEKDLLTVDAGQVTAIERARGSTELPEGTWVLDEPTLRRLGQHLAEIGGVFPVDADLPPTTRVLLDTEWKVRADGQLIVKQVRPFLP